MIEIDILNKLNAPTREERLANLKEILKTTEFSPMVPQYINNHIHTTYSFSPYSPTAAVYACLLYTSPSPRACARRASLITIPSPARGNSLLRQSWPVCP